MMVALVDAVLAGEAGAHRVLRDALMEGDVGRIEVYPGKPNLLARTLLVALGEAASRRVLGELLEPWLAAEERGLVPAVTADELSAIVGYAVDPADLEPNAGDLAAVEERVGQLPDGLASHVAGGWTSDRVRALWLALLRGGVGRLARGAALRGYRRPLVALRTGCRWLTNTIDGDELSACSQLLEDLEAGQRATGGLDRRRLLDLPLDGATLARAAARRIEARRP